jgi:hypothetical protein
MYGKWWSKVMSRYGDRFWSLVSTVGKWFSFFLAPASRMKLVKKRWWYSTFSLFGVFAVLPARQSQKSNVNKKEPKHETKKFSQKTGVKQKDNYQSNP